MTQPQQNSNGTGAARDALLFIVAALWLAGFAAYFFSRTLPNNHQYDRLELLQLTPELLLDNVWSPDDAYARVSGWRYLPQRFDLLLPAAGILAGAWGLGHLALRLLRLRFADWPLGRQVFAMGLGLSLWSLATLLLGLCGRLQRPLFLALIAAAVVLEAVLRLVFRERASPAGAPELPLLQRRFFADSLLPPVCVLAVAPFLLAMLLGSMIPRIDFDMKEYHLGGPKEWYLQGQVTFLPHNVYTSFPFLTEMFPLSGMVLRGYWYRGALAGQLALMTFAPLIGLALISAARYIGRTAAWLTALAFLTTPWIYRIATIAHADLGVTCYLLLALLAALYARHELRRADGSPRAAVLLCGLLAGSAMACKYPGLISVVVPLGAFVGWSALRNAPADVTPARSASEGCAVTDSTARDTPPRLRFGLVCVLFSAGVLATFGPWAARNLADTGNPVYPLAYSLFGGRDWDDELNAKWKRGHSPPFDVMTDPARIGRDLIAHALDVAAHSDWQSPLLFGLLPLAPLVLLPRRRENAEADAGAGPRASKHLLFGLFLYLIWLILTWWGLTHRIDRFWLPLIPVAALLAGIGLAALLSLAGGLGQWIAGNAGSRLARALVIGPVAIAIAFNLAIVTFPPLAGYNAFLIDEAIAREQTATRTMALLNRRLPPGARVLLVGDAEIFDARFDYRYNTVFDRSLFQQWCAADPDSLDDPDIPLASADEIRAKLRDEGITHLFVNWVELLRYRTTYLYTDFVSPRRFRELTDLGILAPVSLDASESLLPLDVLQPHEQQELQRWAPELQLVWHGEPAFVAYQLFVVSGPE